MITFSLHGYARSAVRNYPHFNTFHFTYLLPVENETQIHAMMPHLIRGGIYLKADTEEERAPESNNNREGEGAYQIPLLWFFHYTRFVYYTNKVSAADERTTGKKHFHAKNINWSYRKRGREPRAQIKRTAQMVIKNHRSE